MSSHAIQPKIVDGRRGLPDRHPRLMLSASDFCIVALLVVMMIIKSNAINVPQSRSLFL